MIVTIVTVIVTISMIRIITTVSITIAPCVDLLLAGELRHALLRRLVEADDDLGGRASAMHQRNRSHVNRLPLDRGRRGVAIRHGVRNSWEHVLGRAF